MKTARCRFPGQRSGGYDYAIPKSLEDGIEKGSYVVVRGRRDGELQVVEVTKVQDRVTAEWFAAGKGAQLFAPVLAVVQIEEGLEEKFLAAEERRVEIQSELETRVEEARRRAAFQELASADPTISVLLSELDEL